MKILGLQDDKVSHTYPNASNPSNYIMDYTFLTSNLLRISVRHGSHWGGSPQNGLRDEWTCGTTLASAYVLHCLSATWLQFQIIGRSLRWK